MQSDLFSSNSAKRCDECHQIKSIDLYDKKTNGNVKNTCQNCISNRYKPVNKEKTCDTCHQIKSIDQYEKDINLRGGLRNTCKSCTSLRRNHPDNREWFLNLPHKINPETGKRYERGDKYKNKYVFGTASISRTNPDAIRNKTLTERQLITYDFEEFLRAYIKDRISHKKREYRIGALIHEIKITYKHLDEVFPRDMKCPILGISMRFGGSYDNSVQLDRINNDLGYLDGNVAWISAKANRAKGNLNSSELQQIANWLKDKGF